VPQTPPISPQLYSMRDALGQDFLGATDSLAYLTGTKSAA
jgi:hypothetical protein